MSDHDIAKIDQHIVQIGKRLDELDGQVTELSKIEQRLVERNIQALQGVERIERRIDSIWADLQDNLEVFRAFRGATKVSVWVVKGLATFIGLVVGIIALWQAL